VETLGTLGETLYSTFTTIPIEDTNMVSLRSGSVVGKDLGPETGAAEVTSSRKSPTGKSKAGETTEPQTRTPRDAAKAGMTRKRKEEEAKKGFLASEFCRPMHAR